MPIVTVRKLMFWGNILIFNLFFGFLTPVLVLLNLCRKMPDFYTTKRKDKSVNKFTMTVKPRRDFDYLSFNNSYHNNHIDVDSNCPRDIFVITETNKIPGKINPDGSSKKTVSFSLQSYQAEEDKMTIVEC